MYISLYRRYRPQRFDEVSGQSSAVDVIRRAVAKGNIGHAYLFSGPRGCGKTTIARIFAKAVNCQNPGKDGEPCNSCENCRTIGDGSNLDVIEIDGASNNKVDEIRDLKSHVGLASFSCPYKVYIIDEVHMLSIGAFNALLKTLEEPPQSVLFILATTEPFKVPVTIRSRCQHIPFHSIALEDIVSRLSLVLGEEKMEFEEEALWEIARQSDGGLRDGLSLLEQTITSLDDSIVTAKSVRDLIGGGSYGELMDWVASFDVDEVSSIVILQTMFSKGASADRVLESLYVIFRNLWIFSRWGDRGMESLLLSPSEESFLKSNVTKWDVGSLKFLMDYMASLIPKARRGIPKEVLCGMIVSSLIEPFISPKTSLYLEEKKESSKPSIIEKTVEHVNRQDNPLEDSLDFPPVDSTFEEKKLEKPSIPVKGEVHIKAKIEEEKAGLSKEANVLSEKFNLESFVEKNFDDIPQIVLPLLISDVSLVDDRILFVKVANLSCFNLLSIDRYAYLLQSALKDEYNLDLEIQIVWEDQERLFPSLSHVESPDFPLEMDEIPLPVFDEEGPEESLEEEAGKGVEDAVKMINSQIRGELVYFNKTLDGEEGHDIE